MFDTEYSNFSMVAGCDEVGRGPLAGPVVGSCVLVRGDQLTPNNIQFLLDLGVNDSKKLNRKKRLLILKKLGIDHSLINSKVEVTINQNFSIVYSTAVISNDVIDEINILRASLKAMSEAFIRCYDNSKDCAKVLIDGNKLLNINDKRFCEEFVIKGDSKSVLIGLASIIAKEYRDELMEKLSVQYPGYGLESHAGYPTKKHKEAISALGVTEIHRKTFKGVKEFCVDH
ncbi:ribonuclease HII [Halobacteriovorax sp. HLS]|uniref:ribonuclease HII n=1 Tax=Halobacteriovorax sp. HLS TaxID=2234000 RepID=UPI000FDC83FB|nr:ribonuclease HII [Halobacteriovorax sp. HLS]